MGANRHHRLLLVVIWLAFLSRGLFYCVQQPIWEGYDEWAHFAYIRHIAERRTIPSRTDPVSREVQRSLQLLPLSKSAAAAASGTITHDAFWRLPPEERHGREEAVRRLSSQPYGAGDPSFPALQYEAQQPPLYYLALAPAYWTLRHASLPTQVLMLRILSVAMASSVIFLGYAIARYATLSRTLALLVAVLLACLPGLYIDVCRVGNDSLSIAVISGVILCSLRVYGRRSGALKWLALGMLLGVALLTKAYALAFVPLPALVAVLGTVRHPRAWKHTARWCAAAYVTALAIGGWWYWRSWVTTGTLSGEELDVAAHGFPLARKLAAIYRINWSTVADAGAFSHIWVGGWSFLVLRSWMYRVWEVAAVLAALGLLLNLVKTVRRGRRGWLLQMLSGPPAVLLAAYVPMCLAVAYHSLMVFLAQNINTALGWYLYAVIAPEVVLIGLGLTGLTGKKWSPFAMASICILALALDLYTVHFLLMPYYTGLIGHRASGSLESFRVETLVSRMDVLFRGLSINKPALIGPAAIAAMWAAYMGSTVALGGTAVFTAMTRRPPAQAESRLRVPGFMTELK